MPNIISLVQVRHLRAKERLEELKEELKEDTGGGAYRGTHPKENVFFERAYLQSLGIEDIQVYTAHNEDGTIDHTQFDFYGRD